MCAMITVLQLIKVLDHCLDLVLVLDLEFGVSVSVLALRHGVTQILGFGLDLVDSSLDYIAV